MKRGGWLKRYTRLPAGGKRIARRTPPKRKGGHFFNEDRDEAYLAFVRTRRCVMAGLGPCWGRTEPHHTAKQSHEGKDRTAAPLCVGHHREVETLPKSTWRARYPTVDLVGAAACTYAAYEQEG